MKKCAVVLLTSAVVLSLCGFTKANSDEEFLTAAQSDRISVSGNQGDDSINAKDNPSAEVTQADSSLETTETETAELIVPPSQNSNHKTKDDVSLNTARCADVPEGFSLFQELKNGKMYSSKDSFLYIPQAVDENTQMLVYYAGHYDTVVFQEKECIRYIEKHNPNAVSLWFTYSGVGMIDKRDKRTADLLVEIWGEKNVRGSSILVVGSSNGGYVALSAAAYLKSELDVNTAMIAILDMGEGWGLLDWYFSGKQADELLEMGTVVYHFGRNGGVRKAEGGKKFLSYGIPTVELKCKVSDHDAITKYAFRNGVFSWMLNDGTELDPNAYKIMYTSFDINN